MDTFDKFSRETLISFADTQRNYRIPILKVLGEKPFSAKVFSTIGLKRIKISTDEDLKNIFHNSIIKSMGFTHSYAASGELHDSKINSLESKYEKFLIFASQFNGQNLDIKNSKKKFLDKKALLYAKGLKKEYLDNIIDKLHSYPIPLSDVLDILKVILDAGKKFTLESDRNHLLINFLHYTIPVLYAHGLENPEQRDELIEHMKNQYMQLNNIGDVLNIKLSSQSNIEIEE